MSTHYAWLHGFIALATVPVIGVFWILVFGFIDTIAKWVRRRP